MIAIQLPEVKNFMKHLLLSSTFDTFSFLEGDITTFNTFSINGHVHREFFLEERDSDNNKIPEYSLWKNIREFCFSIIKGQRTPLSFHFTFSLTPEDIKHFLAEVSSTFSPEDVHGLYLNIRYENGRLTCITGTSFTTFSLDKSLEQEWDSFVQKFLLSHSINFEPVD